MTAVVMAYNERESLEPSLVELREQLLSCCSTWEIIIIDDGSTDGTSQLADQLASALEGVRVVHHHPNRGLGGVYDTGFAEARGEWLTFFPADGQFPPSCLRDFLEQREKHDLILGYLPERRRDRLSRFLSFAERLLYKTLFGHFPRFQGIMLVRCSVMRKFKLVSKGRGWVNLMELILRICRGGYPYTSVPTAIRERLSGASKVSNLRAVWDNLRQLLLLRWRLRGES